MSDSWHSATDWVGDTAGDVVDVVGDVVGGAVDVVGDAVKSVGDVVDSAWHGIDGFVNDTIPGGWATVAIAAGAYFGPGLMAGDVIGGEALAPEALGEAGGNAFAVDASAEGASPTLLGEAGAEVAADTQGAALANSGAGGATGSAVGEASTLAPVVDSATPILTSEANLAMANATTDPIAAMNAAQGWTASDATYLKDIGAPADVIQNAGAVNSAYGAKEYLATKGALGELKKPAGAKKPGGEDNTAAMVGLGALLSLRRASSLLT